jgi:hypothetical protein
MRTILACFMLIIFASCAGIRRTELYFGTDIPGGGRVTDADWNMFCDTVISCYFPGGYTVAAVSGKWYDTEAKHTISEPSKLVLLTGKSSRARSAAIDTVVQRYIRYYHQQAVLRTDTKIKSRLVTAK